MNVTLLDIEIGTVFTDAETSEVFLKGSSGTFGPDGYTVCYPKKGGVFQKGEKFATKVKNNRPVSVS